MLSLNTVYLRLAEESLEMRELDDRRYLELKAWLPKEMILIPSDQPNANANNAYYIKQFQWLSALLNFNDIIRERKAAEAAQHPSQVGLPSQPRDREQAEQMGYVMANVVTTVFPERFPDLATLRRFTDKLQHIRTYKPSGSRNMVHAGDLIRYLASEADKNFDGLDREEVEDRTEGLRKKRSQPRK